MKEKKNIIISIIVFILYIIWPYLINTISKDIIITTIAKGIFLFVLIFIYRKTLKIDINNFKLKKYMKKGLKIFLWTIILYIFANAIVSLICIATNMEISSFNQTYNLFKEYPILVLGLTLIYYPIVEELVFKRTLKDIITNKWLFIFVTGLLNAVVTMILTTTLSIEYVYILPNTILSMGLSYIYYNTNNIITPIIYRSIYNIIPSIIAIISILVI